MKIIKDGKKWIKKCEKCGCEFQYNVEDLMYVESYNNRVYTNYIYCPWCGKKIVIDMDND